MTPDRPTAGRHQTRHRRRVRPPDRALQTPLSRPDQIDARAAARRLLALSDGLTVRVLIGDISGPEAREVLDAPNWPLSAASNGRTRTPHPRSSDKPRTRCCAAQSARTASGSGCRPHDPPGTSELKVEPECVVELGDELSGEAADHRADAFDRYGADLLGLGLGVHREAGLLSGEKNLERKDPAGVAGDGHDRDDATAESGCLSRWRGRYWTMTAGRRLSASPDRAGSRSVSRISPRSISRARRPW